ncbi:MAG: hypothetical protein ABIO02_02140 [Patescibacteria group bacterium]
MIKKALLFVVAFTFVTAILAHNTHAQGISPTPTPCVNTQENPDGNCIMVDEEKLGFQIPTFSEILTFAIRLFFIIGGLAALAMLLLGAFTWITSGGEKEKVQAAQRKIQSAVLGLIMIVVVLALVVTLEQVVFAGKLCFGLSCGITIPALLKDPNTSDSNTNGNGSFKLLDDTPTPSATDSATLTPTQQGQIEETPADQQTQEQIEQNNTGTLPQIPNSGRAE